MPNKLSDYELAQALHDRLCTIAQHEDRIQELKRGIADQENDILMELIDNGMWTMFKVDWRKLGKFIAYQHGEIIKGKETMVKY